MQKYDEPKKDMVKLIIEPCYEAIKTELIKEGVFDDNVLKNQNEKIEFKKVNRKLPLVKKIKTITTYLINFNFC